MVSPSSSQYLSTEHERRRPQTVQKDSADFNTTRQCAELFLSSSRPKTPARDIISITYSIARITQSYAQKTGTALFTVLGTWITYWQYTAGYAAFLYVVHRPCYKVHSISDGHLWSSPNHYQQFIITSLTMMHLSRDGVRSFFYKIRFLFKQDSTYTWSEIAIYLVLRVSC